MKLLQVALAGVLGLAGLAAGASSDKAYSPHLDDNTYTYHCEALGITQCNVLGSCTLYENCAHWCVQLSAPGGAVCADAPPKSVEARADPGVSWQNDGKHRYVCLGLDIADFDIKNNFRSFVEHCEKECNDMNHRARCIGPGGPPPVRQPPAASWVNDANNKYICSGLNIEACRLDGRSCSWVKYCAAGCFDTSHGTLCVDKVTDQAPKHDTRAESNSESINSAQSIRKCTPTHRGVFTCIEGFCAVQPGDWCKSGWSCRDDCACCRKNTKRDVLTVKSVENTAEVILPSEEALLKLGDCTPGDYWCHPVGNNYLLICDTNAKWAISADCGKYGPYGCCRGTAWPGPDHRCDCRPGGSDTIDSSISKDAATTMVDKRVDTSTTTPSIDKGNTNQSNSVDVHAIFNKTVSPSQNCKSGEYMCSPFNYGWIIVCDHAGSWQYSANCGKTSTGSNCCRQDPGYPPSCDCRGLPGGPPAISKGDGDNKLLARHSIANLKEASMTAMEAPERCTPGTYRCKPPFTQGWLQVCGQDRIWYLANQFCGPYTCVDIPGDELPRCECSRKPRSLEIESAPASDEATATPQLDQATEQTAGCQPGTSQGEWQVSDTCCGLHTCRQGVDPGTAYCNCPKVLHSFEKSLPARSLGDSLAQPTSGPEDPDEPEFCTPGRFTCGDSDSKVYTCNIKGNWQLSATCTLDHTCARGKHGEAYCVEVGRDAAEPTDDVRGSTDEGLTTLLTLAKEVASSTAKA
ncbi:hypothetical protein BDU57DRAFT_548437 [Ampelomyces quisqualis]|uniref:Uncharacterized protein n=1 Tax=Ampelomyces quisqualis TaxID=50730 RepID=A0A6A5QM11_AMPQU|nr:hypothetical protein BDU57DRAFT_548437 [Ampelomyces quisqualis]